MLTNSWINSERHKCDSSFQLQEAASPFFIILFIFIGVKVSWVFLECFAKEKGEKIVFESYLLGLWAFI